MIYFIPAWYNDRRTMYFNARPWSQKQKLIYTDDITNHVQLATRSGNPYQLIVPNYTPQLRYHMHRLELLESNFVSIFDIIQDLSGKNMEVLNFREFEWAEGTEFVYNPFSVVAQENGQVSAEVEFGTNGQLFWITRIQNNIPTKRYIFDDRGFVSSSIIYDAEGKYHYQEYYNRKREWQIREYFGAYGHHVEVSESAQSRFLKKEYASIEELVFEQMGRVLDQHDQENDSIFLAADSRHSAEVLKLKSNKKVVYSYFQGRNGFTIDPYMIEDIKHVDLILTTTDRTRMQFNALTNIPVLKLPYIDTRFDIGKSRQLKDQFVYFRLDGLTTASYKRVLDAAVRYMKTNKRVHLLLVSFESDAKQQQYMANILRMLLASYDDPDMVLMEENSVTIENSAFPEQESRVSLSFITPADDVIKILSNCRLVVDLANEPDMYTHIAALSAAIPQINKLPSEFVHHKKNGYITLDLDNLYDGLVYYLTGLAHWNESMIYCIKLIEKYSDTEIVKRVRLMLDRG